MKKKTGANEDRGPKAPGSTVCRVSRPDEGYDQHTAYFLKYKRAASLLNTCAWNAFKRSDALAFFAMLMLEIPEIPESGITGTSSVCVDSNTSSHQY